MGYKVTVNHPHFPEGTEISVGNILRVPNGSSVEVSEDDERAFLNVRGLPLHEAYGGDAAINIEGSPLLDSSEIDQVKSFFAPEETVAEATLEESSGAGRSVFTPPQNNEEEKEGGES